LWDEKAGAFKVKPEGKRVLTYIFQQTAEGIGQKQITYELNRRYKPLGRAKVWHTSFVGWVLGNRQVLGEFQSCTHNEQGERIPDGKPIVGYYPDVIPEDLFLRACAVRSNRKRQSGRHARFVNLFVGRVWGRDGYAVQIKSDRAKRVKSSPYVRRAFQSLGHRVGKADACPYSVPYDIVEKLVLVSLDELRADDFKPKKGNGQQINKLVMELAGIEARLTEMADMLGNPALKLPDEIGKVMTELAGRRGRVKADIDRLKQEGAMMEAKPLEQYKTILHLLKEGNSAEQNSLRLKLRALIACLVERIEIEPLKQNDGHHTRIGCNLVITMIGGGIRKAYRHYGTEYESGWIWLDNKAGKKKKGKGKGVPAKRAG
jgi:hypothetical protein